MSGATRESPPPRRPLLSSRISAGGIAAHASAGWVLDAEGRAVVREVFLRPSGGAKAGSAIDALVDDLAVIVSVALQHGVPLAALARSLGREPAGHPASIAGAALDLLTEFQADLEAEI